MIILPYLRLLCVIMFFSIDKKIWTTILFFNKVLQESRSFFYRYSSRAFSVKTQDIASFSTKSDVTIIWTNWGRNHFNFCLERAEFKLSDILQFTSGAATISPIEVTSMTLAFEHDCERQECACLLSANTCSASLTLPVHINNLEESKERFKVAITRTQKYSFGVN